MVMSNKVELAHQDERIQRIEKLDDSMTKLTTDLAATREQMAAINAKLEK